MPTDGVRIPGLKLRWGGFVGLVLVTAGAGTWMMARIVAGSGLTLLEGLILALFVPTFAWIVVPFWTAGAGFLLKALGRDPLSLRPRYGAVGRHGSIAIVERFIRAMKSECTSRILVALADEVIRHKVMVLPEEAKATASPASA